MKIASIKKIGKQDREKQVLLGLVEYYIKTGRPVGSNTLKEAGFGEFSSATIRNYFANLEEEGLLTQPHSSGGRIPTPLAYRQYAKTYLDSNEKIDLKPFKTIEDFESREVAQLLQESADILSKITNCAVFLSAPRFDHDFVIDLKLVAVDSSRCLCIIVTDFGTIKTEILHLPNKLSSFAVKRIESYFHWRLTGLNKPINLEAQEDSLAQTFYNELMVRYLVGYSNFIDEEIYRTGFSRLLSYSTFQEPGILASSLALFENSHSMRLLLRESLVKNQLQYWIGDDLSIYTTSAPDCTVMTIPYYINKTPVGAIGILGPIRMPYKTQFACLRKYSQSVSDCLTKNIYKHQISYRQPKSGTLLLNQKEKKLIAQTTPKLLENKATK